MILSLFNEITLLEEQLLHHNKTQPYCYEHIYLSSKLKYCWFSKK